MFRSSRHRVVLAALITSALMFAAVAVADTFEARPHADGGDGAAAQAAAASGTPLGASGDPLLAQAATVAFEPRAPLVPCVEGESLPCVLVASQPSDIAGVWRMYMGNPAAQAPGGLGYLRYTLDGFMRIGISIEQTSDPGAPFPFSAFVLDGGVLTKTIQTQVAPECQQPATYEARVIRVGSRPVALVMTPIEDSCELRKADLATQPLIWVGD